MALPLGDFTDPLAVQAIEPSIATASPGEVLGATAGAAFDSLPTVSLLRQQQRFNESGPDTNLKPANDPRTFGSDVDAMAAERGDAPTRVTLQPEEANAKAKAAGAQVTFDKPIADTTVQSVIDEHLTKQQRDDVIARNGSAILSGVVPRFVAGSLISLADPIDLGAMMIPAAPEAFVAEKLAAAASAFERTAIRGAAGAVNGAVGMAALEPFNYAMSKADYNDWSAGDALRNIFMGAALGAGGHALLGGLFGREHLRGASTVDAMPELAPRVPEPPPPPAADTVRLYHGGSAYDGGSRWLTADENYAQGYAKKNGGFVHYVDLAADHPELVANTDYNAVAGTGMKAPIMHFDASPEVAAQLRPLAGKAELTPAQANNAMEATRAAIGQAVEGRPVDVAAIVEHGELTRAADDLQAASPAVRPGDAISNDTEAGRWNKHWQEVLARYENGLAQVKAQVSRDETPDMAVSEVEQRVANAKAQLALRRQFSDDSVFDGSSVPAEQAAAAARAQADTAARGMAERAMNPPTDPALAQTAKVNKATLDEAPQLAGTAIDKDLAEITKQVQEQSQRLQQEIASGRIIETQEMRDAMVEADHTENVGKASAQYAACLVGKGLT